MSLITNLDFYIFYLDDYFDRNQHPATADLIFCRVPFSRFVAVLGLYLFFTTKVIPFLMRNRTAFDLKWPLFGLNLLLVSTNVYFFGQALIRSEFGWVLFDFDYPGSHVTAKNMADMPAGYLGYQVRFLDWFDTVFMALRKRHHHMTFLHLYHHSMVPLLGYVLLRYSPFVPAFFLFAICNCFVHVVMHSYYALSVFPGLRPFLWWKRYVTILQLGQFVVYLLYGVLFLFKQKGYPVFWLYFGFTQVVLFLLLFANFYRNAYLKKPNANDCKRFLAKRR